MSDSKKNIPEEPTVDVAVITENHTHKGKPVEKGGTITVAKSQVEWLIKNKVIEG